MSVTLKDVERIAALARLSLSPGEKERMTAQMNTILGYMEKLNEVDTSRVAPLTNVSDERERLRSDEPAPGLTQEEALKNAPSRTDEFFKVPKVIGGGP